MDRQQFIQEVKGSQPALRRLLTALCSGNRAEADDIAQEAYLRAYLSLDSFRGQASFATWIRRIAVNEFISSRRRERGDDALRVDGRQRLSLSGAIRGLGRAATA